MAAREMYFKPGSNSLFYRDDSNRERELQDVYNGTGHNPPVTPPFPEGAVWMGGGFQTTNASIRTSIRWRRDGIMRATGPSFVSAERTPTGVAGITGNAVVWVSALSSGGTMQDSIVGSLT